MVRYLKVPKTPRSTILVVDDEAEICDLVSYNLAREGYRVLQEHDGEAGLQRVFHSAPDLLILDLLLPKMSGLEVLGSIRGEPRTKTLPVLVLTARGTEMDKLVGFERGADDYLTKPFSPKELVARVRAVLRRSRPDHGPRALSVGPVALDPARHAVTLHGRAVDLTPKEFDLLHALLDAAGRVLSREHLLNHVWGYARADEIESRTVDVHVRRLRAKLGASGSRIATVKSVGYRFEVESA